MRVQQGDTLGAATPARPVLQRTGIRPLARRSARLGIKAVAAAGDLGRSPQPGLTVLAYHQVRGHSSRAIDMPVWMFEKQMQSLVESGSVVTLDRGIELISGEQRTARHVALTFDDGTIDFVENVVPILVRHQLPATLYLATSWIEEEKPFWEGDRPLSWAALADACTTGLVSVQCHSHRHLLFDREPAETLAADLDRSIGLIEDRLGQQVRHFAYPKALPPSPAAELQVRQRFVSAALDTTRVNRYGVTDLHRLARSPIQTNDGMRWFRRKAAGGMSLEANLRHFVSGLRYNGADH